MNKKMKILFLLGVFTPLLTNCVATDKDMQSVSLRVRSVGSKVVDIDNEIAKLKKETFEQVRTLQAKESARIDGMESEILILKGLLEEISRANKALRDDISSSRDELHELQKSIQMSMQNLGVQIAEKVSLLEQRLDQISKESNQTHQDITLLKEQALQADNGINGIKRARSLEAVGRARQAAAAVAEAKLIKKLAEGDINIKPVKKKAYLGQEQTAQSQKVAYGSRYEDGLRSYNAKNYIEAARIFSSYINEHPNGKYLADVYFMRGECYYSQKEYESAILEYQTVIEDYFDHARAPVALLKQGLSFEKINDSNAAKILYQQILDNYPDSEQIPGAQRRLESIQ